MNDKQSRVQPEVLSYSGLCNLFGLSDNSSSMREIIRTKGFPASFTIPGLRGKKWLTSEVVAYIKKVRVYESETALKHLTD
jgi:hypothetical protein